MLEINIRPINLHMGLPSLSVVHYQQNPNRMVKRKYYNTKWNKAYHSGSLTLFFCGIIFEELFYLSNQKPGAYLGNQKIIDNKKELIV